MKTIRLDGGKMVAWRGDRGWYYNVHSTGTRPRLQWRRRSHMWAMFLYDDKLSGARKHAQRLLKHAKPT